MKDQAKRSKPTRSTHAVSRTQALQLRRALQARRAQLLRVHEEHQELVSEAEPESGDLADVAEGVIEDRERAALDEHDRGLLEEIEHALAKFDAGTYGVSEKTGRPIAFERLLAVPWARYDSDEAERIEHDAR
jgi:DnaK suppressor protein